MCFGFFVYGWVEKILMTLEHLDKLQSSFFVLFTYFGQSHYIFRRNHDTHVYSRNLVPTLSSLGFLVFLLIQLVK